MDRDRRRHLPFALFVAALAGVAAWLQLFGAAYVPLFLSLHVFFQIALGATAIAVFRNVVGLRTYGTFSAVIVAVAMLASGPVLGFLLFAFMLGVVTAARASLATEGVQESHRMAILVTMIAVAAVASSLLGAFTRTPGFAYAALFPILITAWIAERLVEEMSRVGGAKAARSLAFTIVAIVLAYVVMLQDALVVVVARNPVLWVGLVVMNWYLGTHLRVRLSERLRFRGARPRDPDVALGEGVLTMNVRNRDFVDRYNPKALLASSDKAKVKSELVPHGIPMPRTYLYVRGRDDLARAGEVLDRVGALAIKPADAHGGEGILLVRGRTPEGFRTNGRIESKAAILRHIGRILDGDFRDGMSDVAILEELLEPDPTLAPLAVGGVADIRVLTLLGHPVMAMARLPTRLSKGRANLHSGAVGAGIDLASGRIVSAVWKGESVEVHPDTGVSLRGFLIPRWREVLEIACEAQEASGLGFAGVDVVLDARHGPVVLEVNRRPGLDIQNANRQGLLPRLRAIEEVARRPVPVERRVAVALDLDARRWPSGQRASAAPMPSVGPPGVLHP